MYNNDNQEDNLSNNISDNENNSNSDDNNNISNSEQNQSHPPVSNPITTKYIDSNDYITVHSLRQTIGEMLNGLLHELDPNPFIYMVRYLSSKVSEDILIKNHISISPPFPSGRPIVKYPKFALNTNSLLAKYLTKDIWKQIKYRKTRFGGNINNLSHLSESAPFDNIGCIISDSDCIKTFPEVLLPILNQVHKVNIILQDDYNAEKYYHNVFDSRILHEDTFSSTVNELNNILNSFTVSFSRNVSNLPFNQYISRESQEYINKMFSVEIMSLIETNTLPISKEDLKVYSYVLYPDDCEDIMKKSKFYYDYLDKCNLKTNWPQSRTVYTYTSTDNNDSNDNNNNTNNNVYNIVMLINFIDHFHLIVNSDYNNVDIVKTISTAIDIIKHLNSRIMFDYHKQLGYMTTLIGEIGAGMKICMEMPLMNLHKTQTFNFTKMLIEMGFDLYSFKPNQDNETSLYLEKTFKLSNKSIESFLKKYIYYVKGIASLDKINEKLYKTKFKKKHLITQNFILKETYEKYFEAIQYRLTCSGRNINDLIINDKDILFAEQREYESLYKFVMEYVLLEQGFDVGKYEHIHRKTKEEEQEDAENGINKEDELNFFSEVCGSYFQYENKVESIGITIRRNIQGFDMSWNNSNSNNKERNVNDNEDEDNCYSIDEILSGKRKIKTVLKHIEYGIQQIQLNTNINTKYTLYPIIQNDTTTNNNNNNDNANNDKKKTTTQNKIETVYDRYKDDYNILSETTYKYNTDKAIIQYQLNTNVNFKEFTPRCYGIVNNIDNFKLIGKLSSSTTKSLNEFDFREIYVWMLSYINQLSQYVKFSYHTHLGFLTANPSHLGTAISISITFKNLHKNTINDIENTSIFFKKKLVKYDKTSNTLRNIRTVGLSEVELFSKVKKTIRDIIEYDNKQQKVNNNNTLNKKKK